MMRPQLKKFILPGLFVVLLVLTYRQFFLADFDMVGHNWDWTIPATDEQLNRIDAVSRYLWKRPDLGAPSYLIGVHYLANVAVRLLNVFLPPKWVIFSIFLTVHVVALWSFKKMADYFTRISSWNYLPAVLYAFSPLLFNDITGGSWYIWISYAFLPLYFVSVLKFLAQGQVKQLAVVALSSYFVMLATQNFFFINFILLAYIVRLLFYRQLRWIKTCQRYSLMVFVLAALNSYWLIGQVYVMADLWQNQVLDEKAFGGWGQQAGQTQTLLHIFTLVGYWDRHLYLYALPLYLKVLFLGAVAGTWLAIGWHLIQAKRRQVADLLFWLLLFIIFAFFTKARNAPWGELTMNIFKAVPLLRIYRTPYHLMRAMAFITPILLALTFHFFYQSTARRKAVAAIFLLIVTGWISGWWYNGDLGAATLLKQGRDHVDFFKLSPTIKDAYQTNESTSLAHRALFLPTVESPLYLNNDYQQTAQGGIPEYDYLKNPTVSAESNRSLFADFIDRSLCGDNPILPTEYLALLNIGRVIQRPDVAPMHTWCHKRWNDQMVAQLLQQQPGLQLESAGARLPGLEPEAYGSPEAVSLSEKNIVITYDQEKRAAVIEFDANESLLNGETEISDTGITAAPAEVGDLLSIGDRIVPVQANMRVTMPFAAEIIILRQANNLLTELFTDDIDPAAFINCSSGKLAEMPLKVRLVADEAAKKSALELSTDGVDTACFRRAYDVNIETGSLYLFSADYQNVAGNVAQIHFDVTNGQKTDVTGDTIPQDNDKWHTYQRLFKASAAHSQAQIYLYAPQSAGPKSVINRYANVRLDQLAIMTHLNLLDYVPHTNQLTLNQAVNGDTYRVKAGSFLPLFYTPSVIQFSSAPPDYLYQLSNRLPGGKRPAVIFREDNSDLPGSLINQTLLHAPGLKPDGKISRISLPVSNKFSDRKFDLYRTLSASAKENLVLTYDQDQQTIAVAFDANGLRLNEETTIDDILITTVAAEVGDLLSIGDRIVPVQANMRVTMPFAAQVRILRRNDNILTESFGETINQTEFINCSSGRSGEAPLAARQATDESAKTSFLELSTDGVDTACWRRAYDVALNPNGLYIFSADYQNIAGDIAQIHFDVSNGQQQDVLGDNFIQENNQWNTYQRILKTSAAHTQAQIYLYAPQTGAPPKPVINRYANISLDRLEVIRNLNLLDYLSQADKLTWNEVVKEALSLPDAQAWLNAGLSQNTANLLLDSSFESGLWQKEPGDCHSQPQPGDVKQIQSDDASDGQRSLELTSKANHGACTTRAFLVHLKPNTVYKFSFDYRNVQGDAVQFSYTTRGQKAATASQILRVSDQNWHTYETFFTAAEEGALLDVYFYAPGDSAITKNGSIVRFDNVRLHEWAPASSLNYYLEAQPKQPPTPPANLSFRPINPTKYRVQVHQAAAPFLLVFNETFDAKWTVYLGNKKPLSQQLGNIMSALADISNHDLNWWSSTAELWPASRSDLTNYIQRGWVGEDGSVSSFVSQQLNGTIQDDNIAPGYFWDTWYKQAALTESHIKVNGYANGWWVDPAALCGQSDRCVQNPDQTYDMEFIIEFWPQRLRYLGLLASGLALLIFLGYAGQRYWRQKHRLV